MMDKAVTSASVFDGRVPYPEFASIETTMKCNLQCPMCLPYLAGSTVHGRHMDPTTSSRSPGRCSRTWTRSS